MIRFENLIMEELEGEFPRDKYNTLIKLKTIASSPNGVKKKASELIFISQINRNGDGLKVLSDTEAKELSEDNFLDTYAMHHLSLSENTYIAIGFNSYVVKIK